MTVRKAYLYALEQIWSYSYVETMKGHAGDSSTVPQDHNVKPARAVDRWAYMIVT